jgi:4-coumarate--CoA ligase
MPRTTLSLPVEDIFRLVRDIFIDELSQSRRNSFNVSAGLTWTPETSIHESGIGLDSLERFTIAGHLNETFQLYRSGVEDNLLRAETLGDTVDVIQAGLGEFAQEFSFYSGGSTGAPHIVSHTAEDLLSEIHELSQLFPNRRRVIVTVPVHHIYGFLFGVLLPREMGIPIVDAQYSLLSGERRPRSGDLVVSIPFLWERVLGTGGRWEADIMGSSSTAPLSTDTADRVCRHGVERLVEVYGSSETAGVGWRDRCASEATFTLFSRWERAGEGELRNGARTVELPDRLVWHDERHFEPAGRRDAVVQVGGTNVDLDELRKKILELIPEAHDCTLRLGSEGRIRAFLAVSRRSIDEQEVTARLHGELPAAALPRSITIGPALPRSSTGKISDW